MFQPENLRIDIFTSFAEAETAWRAFERDADCYAFQTFDWLSAWSRHIGAAEGVSPAIAFVGYPLGTPLLILPLGVVKRGPLRVLTWLGGKIADYHGPLISRENGGLLTDAVFHTIWRAVLARLPAHDAVALEQQPEFIGGRRNPFLALPSRNAPSGAHFTAIVGDIESFIAAKAGNKRRWQMRRKADRLAELGEVRFIEPKTDDEIERVMTALFEQKGRSYAELGVRDIFEKPAYRAFYAAMAKSHAEDGFVHLSALTLNGEIVAAHWGLVHRGRFYFLMPSYTDGTVRRLSPGVLLLRHLFEWSIENGAGTFDFTIGDEAYKTLWCDQELALFDHLEGRSALGRLYVFAASAALRMKRAIKQSPALWPRVMRARSLLRQLATAGTRPRDGGS